MTVAGFIALTCMLLFVGHCAAGSQKNIVVILTDDQDVTLGSLATMPNVQKYLIKKGLYFTNAFADTPICCPTRSSIVTGRYIHNHGATNNSVSGNCNGDVWRNGPEKEAIPVWAKKAGYQTFYAGKYLNQYGTESTGGVEHIPPGWDYWYGLVGNSRYYDYDVSDNGKKVHFGDNYATDYFPDIIKQKGLEFIRNNTGDVSKSPFFMIMATPSPHAPARVAPQYHNKFINQTAPRTPNYNLHVDDRHWLVRFQTTMDEHDIAATDNFARKRWGTLQTVDEIVVEVVELLEKRGVLDDTYIIYTSDHGFHLGQFCMRFDKRMPYEDSIRVPFIARGPNVPQGKTTHSIYAHVDLAPTIVTLMGLEVPAVMDGRSLEPVLHGQAEPGNVVDTLIEYYGEHGPELDDVEYCGSGCTPYPSYTSACDSWNNTYNCLRNIDAALMLNDIYCELEGDNLYPREYYDLVKDPFQLHNQISTMNPDRQKAYSKRLSELKTCQGNDCRHF